MEVRKEGWGMGNGNALNDVTNAANKGERSGVAEEQKMKER